MSRGIAILGSTGSIGRNALRVIDALGPGYEVVGLSAHRSIDLLAEQVRRYRPARVAVSNDDYAERFRSLMDGWDARILVGSESLVEMAKSDGVDTVLTAVVGAAESGRVACSVMPCSNSYFRRIRGSSRA